MAILAPVAFAVGGAAIFGAFGYATLGASVGWLVGSWLFGPKQKAYDPGAQGMQPFNQAIRGNPIPILFGTNRVGSNIIWENNFKTVRKKSGGGWSGKPKVVTYTYYWDLLFSIGMSEERMYLYRAWKGTESVSQGSLYGLSESVSFSFDFSLQGLLEALQQTDPVELEYDEGFYHGSLPTGDLEATNWSHFESVEGGPYRFPYTTYIGFKQLKLDDTAAPPQMTWEIGPLVDEIVSNDAPYSNYNDDYNNSSTGYAGSTNGHIVGKDGKLYTLSRTFSFSYTGGYKLVLWNATDNVEAESWALGDMDAIANSIGMDPGGDWVFDGASVTDKLFCCSLGDTSYFMIMVTSSTSKNSGEAMAFILYDIDVNGNVSPVGGYVYDDFVSILSYKFMDIGAKLYIYGAGTTADPLICSFVSNFGVSLFYNLACLPSIDEMLITNGGPLIEDTLLQWRNRLIAVGGNVNGIYTGYGNSPESNVIASDSHTTYDFVLPVYDNGEYKSRMYFYCPVGLMERQNTSTSAYNLLYKDNYATYPRGFIAYFDIEIAPGGGAFNLGSDVYYDNNNWKIGGLFGSFLPFPDDGYLADGTTVNYYASYDIMPTVQKLADNRWVVLFAKHYPVEERILHLPDDDLYGQVRAFLWDPTTKKASYIGGSSGVYGNSITEYGEQDTGGNGVGDGTLVGLAAFYYQAINKVVLSWSSKGTPTHYTTVLFSDWTSSKDVTPAFIIYKILTSPVHGIGVAEEQVDFSSYLAAHQYCLAEGALVSVQYLRPENALSAIDELLSLYGGFLIDNGGLIRFGLQEYTAAPVRTINNSRLLVDDEGVAPVNVTKGAKQDTYNRVKVNYFDRNLKYRPNFVEISDEVDIDLNGPRPQEFPAKFVMSEAFANKIAIRALWSNLYARDIYQFKLGVKDSDLEPGDVITLVDSYHPDLASGVQVRITNWEETSPNQYTVAGVQEIEWIANASWDPTSSTEYSPTPLGALNKYPADFQAYELPKEFEGADPKVYFAYRQWGNVAGSYVYTSPDGVTFSLVSEEAPYNLSGIIAEQLPSREPGFVEENVKVYMAPVENFDVTTKQYGQTQTLDDVNAGLRRIGDSVIVVNSEVMAYEGVNLVATNEYRFDRLYRGWGGTHIQNHSSGATVYFHSEGGIHEFEYNEDAIGTTFYYKVQPFDFYGTYIDISSITAKEYTIKGTYFRPQVQAPLKTFVQSPVTLDVQSQNLGFITKKEVISGGSPVQIEWGDSARVSGYGAQGYAANSYGHFDTDITSHEYRVEVLSADLSTVVRCVSVSTTAFNYSVDANSEDFNGWNGSFAIRVTPYNTYGDALRNRVKILELF